MIVWRQIFWAMAVIVAVSLAVKVQAAESTTKEVCKDVIGKDNKPVKNKDGSIKQACKNIKVHKKLEGTPVPEKPAKK